MGLTIRELATKINITSTALSGIERNCHQPSPKSLRLLSEVLQQPIYYLGCLEELPDTTLGDRLKKARAYRGLSIIEGADYLGVNVKTIKNWEANRKIPSKRFNTYVEDFLKIIYE